MGEVVHADEQDKETNRVTGSTTLVLACLRFGQHSVSAYTKPCGRMRAWTLLKAMGLETMAPGLPAESLYVFNHAA